MKPTTKKFINFPVTKIIVGLAILVIVLMAVQKIGLEFLNYFMLGHVIGIPLIGVIASVVTIPVYYYLFMYYERRYISELWLNKFGFNALVGFFIGFGFMSVVILIMYIGKSYVIVDVHPISYLIPALLLATSSAVFEEIVFRGIIFRITEERLGSVLALIISSSIFGFGHLANQNSTLFSAIAITIEAGILLGAAYMYSRNLWLPIFIHFAWNFSEGGIYGAIISGNGLSKSLVTCKMSGSDLLTGGAFGPENSLQAVILGLIVGLVFFRMAKKNKRVIAPYWKRWRKSDLLFFQEKIKMSQNQK